MSPGAPGASVRAIDARRKRPLRAARSRGVPARRPRPTAWKAGTPRSARCFDIRTSRWAGRARLRGRFPSDQSHENEIDHVAFALEIEADLLQVVEQPRSRVPKTAGRAGQERGQQFAPDVGGALVHCQSAPQPICQAPHVRGRERRARRRARNRGSARRACAGSRRERRCRVRRPGPPFLIDVERDVRPTEARRRLELP